MFSTDNFNLLFVVTAFLFQIVLVIHFAIRKWHFDIAIRYGPIMYALSLPALVVSILLLLGGKAWSLWLSGLFYIVWAIFGYTVEYIRKIEWRNPICWSILVPYVTLYLATAMFYWFPLALIHRPLWYVYALLFIISTILNVTSHKKPDSKKVISGPGFPWLYLLVAYGLAWIFWIPIALMGQNYQESPLLLALMFLGVFGPGIAGIILTYREQGREGGKDYWRRVFDFRRITLKWYTLILLLFPALHLIAIGITKLLRGSPPDFAFVRETMSAPTGILMVVVLYLLQAGLEELGWRGYMLERLQERWKPLAASLILGVAHTFWHLPTFWIIGTNQSTWKSGIEPLAFMGFVVAGSIYSTWCYNDNRRSILSTILLHTAGNLSAIIFAMTGSGKHVFTILLSLSAVAIGVAWMLPSRKQKRVVSI